MRVRASVSAIAQVCLREVERCNVFVGMYGARYGLAQSADALKGMPSKDDEQVSVRDCGHVFDALPTAASHADDGVEAVRVAWAGACA
jgi:hypothetical protein